MALRDVLIVGHDDGHGFKIVDPATGDIMRQVQGSWWTDNNIDLFVKGNDLYVLDSDSSLVRADLDGVVHAKVDIGYYGTADTSQNRMWSIYANDTALYHLHRWSANNPTPTGAPASPVPADSNVWYLVVRDPLTLAITSEIKLDDPVLFDSVGNTNHGASYVFQWGDTSFWMHVSSGPSAGNLIEIAYTGVPTGRTITTPQPSANAVWKSSDVYITMTSNYYGDYGSTHETRFENIYIIDYTTATSTPIPNIIAAGVGSVWYGGDWGDVIARVEGNVITGVSVLDNYTFPPEHPTWPNKNNAIITFSLNLDTQTFTEISRVWLQENPDKGNTYSAGYNAAVPYLTDKYILMDYYDGYWIVDCTNGIVELSRNWPDFQQSYSSDSIGVENARLVTVTAHHITGTVNDAGPAQRKLFLYDMATGTKIADTTSLVDGTFEFITYTTTPKFIVCASSSSDKNHLVSGYIIPTEEV